jgi:hypothetical protein
MNTLGLNESEIDYMNLRTTYMGFRQAIRNLLENDHIFKSKV